MKPINDSSTALITICGVCIGVCMFVSIIGFPTIIPHVFSPSINIFFMFNNGYSPVMLATTLSNSEVEATHYRVS